MIENQHKNCKETEGWKAAQLKSRETSKLKKLQNIQVYNENKTKCLNCNCEFEYYSRHKKFCNSSCSASFNNKFTKTKKKNQSIASERLRLAKPQEIKICKNCSAYINLKSKFCSSKCCLQFKINKFLETFETIKKLPSFFRNYLLKINNYSCSICGWSKMNEFSKTYPLIVDHIDGNSENNNPTNLRVLCPNCDSLTSTHKGLNRGNGREYRRKRYQENKSY